MSGSEFPANPIKSKDTTLNFIALSGFVVSILSVPFFFLCLGQLLGLILSIIGLSDAKKCGNKGRGFAVIGIILSSILIVLTPIVLFSLISYAIKYSQVDLPSIFRIASYFLNLIL